MRLVVAAWCLALALPRLAAQEAPATNRAVTATVGVGNSFGWFGGQAERYLARGRASVFAGIGYTPSLDETDPSGATFAGGVRGYTGGSRHRGFLEASVSQIDVEMREGGARRYGPGIQVGYQYVARRGFTLMVSGGVGHPRGGNEILGSSATALFGIGAGYTWR